MKQKNFLFENKLSSMDPDISYFINAEEERQGTKLQMIASESLCPKPVRECLDTAHSHKYAEGYPSSRMMIEERVRIEKEPERYLAFHRRYGDRRFYKGAEFSNFVEVLAQRRAAEIFANPNAAADKIFVNVQSLSGAAANNAVYNSFLVPGDTIMGMSLAYGGHLTHGSPFNRSGRQYNVIPYTVDFKTGKFDYEELERMAIKHKPKIIIAGASAYPWSIDWAKLKAIAEKVPVQIPGLNQPGALLMADISHPAGLVTAGLFSNPVGTADIATMTTHKTLCGPRGAIIITTNEEIAKRIDLGVFPGEQGGPHINQIVAKAVAFKIAATKEFKALQQRIYDNCQTLAQEFKSKGLTLAYGGTNTHLLLIDLHSLKTKSGVPLEGDITSNILDLCGITCNKNALPGDETGARPRGVRFGTTILSQLGMGKSEMKKIAQLIYYVLTNIQTFSVISHSGEIVRGKIDLNVIEKVRAEVAKLLKGRTKAFAGSKATKANAIEISGERATAFLQSLIDVNLYQLANGNTVNANLRYGTKKVKAVVQVKELAPTNQIFIVLPTKDKISLLYNYFMGLSDGYISFGHEDIYAKVEGPVVIKCVKQNVAAGFSLRSLEQRTLKGATTKSHISYPKSDFAFKPFEGASRKTVLYDEHLKLTQAQFMVPFAGWSMPIWYTRASAEHQAVRNAAGLFDVSHMGKLEISGPYATRFLDIVTTNFVPKLKIGQSHYSYIMDADGNVLDDILLYRIAAELYLMVVNAANKEKIEQWLHAVNNGEVIIDRDNPGRELESKVSIVDRGVVDPWINVALQGKVGLDILLKLAENKEDARKLRQQKKTFFITMEFKGITALIARTGYTGEDIAYEIFVSKDDAARFWDLLLVTGKEMGIKPCGLAARDSLRTEAGLPLYGHELNGDYSVTPTQASYGAFIKRHKIFFIGRKPYLKKEKDLKTAIVRFKIATPNARAIKTGDVVSNSNSEIVNPQSEIGRVTSCTLVMGPSGPSQIGLALVDKKYSGENSNLHIKPTPRQGSTAPNPAMQAVVIMRFMVK